MVTPRHSGNRGIGNLLAQPASLVKPLIPLARISEIGTEILSARPLALRDILKSSKMVETHPSKTREKATQ